MYLAELEDGTRLAVKKLNGDMCLMEREFRAEVDTLSSASARHENLVPLQGFCVRGRLRLLLYPYMANGSLHDWLHDRPGGAEALRWRDRLRIARGASRGVLHIHEHCTPRIVHRDIKSSNILLDHHMEARLSDFGLATLMNPSASHVTTLVAGTFGYLAPEYFDTGRATTKGDVYSYGVVLLELLTGKRPTDESFLENGTRLVTWVRETMEEKREEHAIDEALLKLHHQLPTEEVRLVFSVADKCLDSDPASRPTMAQVVKMLEQGNTTHHSSSYSFITSSNSRPSYSCSSYSYITMHAYTSRLLILLLLV